MTLYFVRPTNGSDSNDGLTFANAFLTTQKAADTATTLGDEVRLCNEADETPSAKVDFDTSSVGANFIGADSIDGTPLTSGFYTISGSSLPATTNLLEFANGFKAWFTRVRITGATDINIKALGTTHITLTNCRVDNATNHGYEGNNGESNIALFDTEIDNNGQTGLKQSTTSRGAFKAYGGSIHDNGDDGVNVGAQLVFMYVEIYDNGQNGLRFNGGVTPHVSNCVFFGNTESGILVNNFTLSSGVIVNNSFAKNGEYGIEFLSTELDDFPYRNNVATNHYMDNTSGAIFDGTSAVTEANLNADRRVGTDNLFGDGSGGTDATLIWTSVTDGSENFIPLTGSILDRAGKFGMDIGSRKAADPAGGGGGMITHPGMAGGFRG